MRTHQLSHRSSKQQLLAKQKLKHGKLKLKGNPPALKRPLKDPTFLRSRAEGRLMMPMPLISQPPNRAALNGRLQTIGGPRLKLALVMTVLPRNMKKHGSRQLHGSVKHGRQIGGNSSSSTMLGRMMNGAAVG